MISLLSSHHVIGRATAKFMGPATTTAMIWMSSGTCRSLEHKTTETISNRVTNSWMMSSSSRLPQRRFQSTTSTTTTTPSPSAGAAASVKQEQGKASFMEWYEGCLSRRPVVTKMFTGGFLWGVGDAVAQLVPQASSVLQQKQSSSATDASTTTTTTTTTATSALLYDWPRTTRAVVFGFALHAPTSHLHFNFLEWMTVRAGFAGWKIPVFKTIMEQFVYWSWVSNSMYHGAMGAMQGLTLSQIYKRIEDVLWDTQKAQWAFWIPVQLLNFNYVPVRHQLNVVLLTSIVWTALLSAWYPPVVAKEEPTVLEVAEVETKKEE